MRRLSCLILLCLATAAAGAEPANQMHLAPETRAWFRNPDGSCVQCSIGMCGVHCNDPNAATLLWDTEYGRAERGGSWPGRVSQYAVGHSREGQALEPHFSVAAQGGEEDYLSAQKASPCMPKKTINI